MKTIIKVMTIDEIIEDKTDRCPMPIDAIPNNMGINLCAVKSVTWEEQDDGQLVSMTVNFIPEVK